LQNGPPVIELGGVHSDHGGEGDIVVGQRHPELDGDHLSGFYSVDFDDFATGDAKPRKPAADGLEKSPKQLSVHVSGLKAGDTRELAQLFKEGRTEGHKAYISRLEDDAPSGFNKVTLPFLDPSLADQYKDNLPSVFIAPVGYKVPPGYKGHPLPYDPASVDRLNTNKPADAAGSANDIDGINKSKNPFLANRNKQLPKRTSTTVPPVSDSSDESQQNDGKTDGRASLFDSTLDPSSIVLNKLKLARNRPSLTTFYNKTRSQQATVPVIEEEAEAAGTSGTKKRKRVLTKVVRKPYNPETTTPPTSAVTHDVKTTVVRIANPSVDDELVEFQTRASPIPTTSLPEQEETTEGHVWTTLRQEEQDAEPEVTTVQPIAAAIAEEVKIDSDAEPSDAVHTFVTTTPVPATAVPETTTTTSGSAYEPTPANPDQRLERFRTKNRKPGHKVFASFPANEAEDLKTSEEEVSTSPATSAGTAGTTSTDRPYGLIRNRLNLRKYGFNTGATNSFEANSAANVFGQRIRARKRPANWTPEDEEEQAGVTPEVAQSNSQTTKKSKADQYKKKFRPFFDQLYDQLTGNTGKQEQEEQDDVGEEVDEDGEPIRGWARRSTTTPNPFTINAEIYEVHPDSRERITTTRPTTTTTTTTTLPPTTTLPVADNEYEAGDRVDDQPEEDLVYVDTNNPAPLEYVEFKLKQFDSTESPLAQFDLAFKPSQEVDTQDSVGLVVEGQKDDDRWNAISVPPEIPASVPEEDHNGDSVSDTQNPAPVQPAINVENFIPFKPEVVEDQTQSSRLHEYEKNIQPQLQHWTEEHFVQGSEPIVNEHTQQHMHASEGDFIPFQPRDPEGPRPAYVEIQRKPVVAAKDEEVEDIYNVVDQAYQLQDVQAPAADVEIPVTEKADEEPTEATTQVIFVTRPTTVVVQDITEHVEDADEAKLTTETPAEEATHHDVEVEPQPEVEASAAEDHETEEVPTSTQEYFEVTTFRPKVTGGFFENFNLGNILGFILPSSPATTTTTTTTASPEETTTIETDETTVKPEVEVEPVPKEKEEEKTEPVDEAVSVEPAIAVDPAVEEHAATVADEVTDPDVATETTVDAVTTQETVLPHEEEVVKVDHAEVSEDQAEAVEVTTQEAAASELPPLRFGRPKAIAQPGEEEAGPGNELINSGDVDLKTANISKSVYGAIKREEYLKNWVASRKYHKFTEAGNKHGVIIGASSTDETATEEESADESTAVLPFVPTVLPNINLNKDDASEWETSGVSVKAKRRKVNPLLDKLSSSRKSLKDSLLSKSQQTSTSTTSSSTTTTTTASSSESSAPFYPRGSDTKIFKQWQGDSLSQAEFERKVLGVSTATEVSVKSVICVRGRCYNADNVPSFIGN
jgi:hypothetical protein